MNEDTQKKVVETVRQGLDESKPSKTARRVEIVGWLPSEGVMAVAVYVILDIEFPRLGLIRLDAFAQALVELRASMK